MKIFISGSSRSAHDAETVSPQWKAGDFVEVFHSQIWQAAEIKLIDGSRLQLSLNDSIRSSVVLDVHSHEAALLRALPSWTTRTDIRPKKITVYENHFLLTLEEKKQLEVSNEPVS
jgi:hypothetical protein